MAIAPATESIASLAKKHRNLRRRVPGLLAVGTGLLLALLYGWFTQPTRASLSGYRFRQVGVRVDKSRWILAYRDGRTEILFCAADTSQGWQRHELSVDSTQVRALALDWGGKALTVGDNGVVRVYDSLLRPIDSLRRVLPPPPSDSSQQPLLSAKQRQSVVVDKIGKTAVVITENGQVYRTNNGGRYWVRRRLPENPFPKNFPFINKEPVEAGSYSSLDGTSTRFRLVTRRGRWSVNIPNLDTAQTLFGSGFPFLSYPSGVLLPWRKGKLSAAVAWCGVGPAGNALAIDRQGNWVSKDTSGLDAASQRFFNETISVALLDSAGNFLGVSATQLFQHQVTFFGATMARKQSESAAKKPVAKPTTKTQPALAKTSTRRPVSSAEKIKRTTPSGSSNAHPKAKEATVLSTPPTEKNAPDQRVLELVEPNSNPPQNNPAVQQKLPTKESPILRPRGRDSLPR